MSKLNYKITGRRRPGGEDKLGLEYVDVEWTHEQGDMIQDHILLPDNHPPIHPLMPQEQDYVKVPVGTRKVLKDCLCVKAGTKDSIVMQMLEEKRESVAQALGLEP